MPLLRLNRIAAPIIATPASIITHTPGSGTPDVKIGAPVTTMLSTPNDSSPASWLVLPVKMSWVGPADGPKVSLNA
jgi:hypothetical protein